MVDSDVTKLVVVLGGIKDVNKPEKAEIAAGVDITCATVAGMTLGMIGSDTIDGKSVCDKGNVVNYASANYEGELDFFTEADEDATAHLNAMNLAGPNPWPLSFSYGRAMQSAALAIWAKDIAGNIGKAQEMVFERARANGLAALGEWKA